jgi:D-arabinose 1-dehydrogenase-like Zn-dependent alcohol dehydrogenase
MLIIISIAICYSMGQRSICGSAAGSSGVATKMLAFAALHGVTPMVEKHLNLADINKVCAKVAAGKVQYRAVCVTKEE